MKKSLLSIAILLSFCVSSYALDEFDVEKEFSRDLKTYKGTKGKIDNLKGKTVLLYFTAAWCGPCQKFTPSVIEFQEKNKDNVEVVVISRDRNKKAAKANLKSKNAKSFHMILPVKLSDKVISDFGIRGIPTVVVLNSEGKVVSQNGRSEISSSTKLPDDWK